MIPQTEQYLSSFHQRIRTQYQLDLLTQDQWISSYTTTTLGIIKQGTKTNLIAKAIFLEDKTNILFRSIILTPQNTIFQPKEILNPSRDQIYRILVGHYEAYINAETNIKEILKEIKPYRIK